MSAIPSWPAMEQGTSIQLLLATGLKLDGTVENYEGDWLYLRTPSALLALAKAQVAAIALEGKLPNAKAAKRGGKTSNEPSSTMVDEGPDVPDDETLRKVAMAILDGIEGPELRAIGGLSASRLARVRQAFECARGNLQIEDLPRPRGTWSILSAGHLGLAFARCSRMTRAPCRMDKGLGSGFSLGLLDFNALGGGRLVFRYAH